MDKTDQQIIEEVLARTEGQSNATRAAEIAKALQQLRLPPRVPVGGIITPQ
jgi:hypothetical protein